MAPARDTNEVQSLGTHREALGEALPGDLVGFSVETVSIKDVCHGAILTGDSKYDLPVEAADFLTILNHSDKPVMPRICAWLPHSSHCLQIC